MEVAPFKDTVVKDNLKLNNISKFNKTSKLTEMVIKATMFFFPLHPSPQKDINTTHLTDNNTNWNVLANTLETTRLVQ